MIGYVMDDREMVDKALKGSAKDGKTGFLPQLDALFSPEGYYDEGPGYQRYAIYPFITLAECINNNQPELHIFDYRGGILRKAVNTLLQCTYEGDIFLMNDAIAKDIHTYEILFSTNIAYKAAPKEKGMLGMVQQQGIVTLTDAGATAAKAIAKGEAKPFAFRSEVIKAGPDGNDGGLAIIRGNDAAADTAISTGCRLFSSPMERRSFPITVRRASSTSWRKPKADTPPKTSHSHSFRSPTTPSSQIRRPISAASGATR